MKWNYDTLIAPFSFPIYKNAEELSFEKDKIRKNIIPIYRRQSGIALRNIDKFTADAKLLEPVLSEKERRSIEDKLAYIYKRGIIYVSDTAYTDENMQIKIIENNIAEKKGIAFLYRPGEAYTELKNYTSRLRKEGDDEKLWDLDMAAYIEPNILFDHEKTNLELKLQLSSISLTRGMVAEGDIIILRGETVTAEKLQILDSYKKAYDEEIQPVSVWRTMTGYTIVSVLALLALTLFLYHTKKRVFLNNKHFIFLYTMYLLTVLIACLNAYYKVNIWLLPVLFFVIVVNVLFDRRAALFLLLSLAISTSIFATDGYFYMIMQILSGIVIINSLSQFQKRSQLFISIFWGFLVYLLVYVSFTLIREGDVLTSENLNDILMLALNCLLLTLTYVAIYVCEKIFGYTSEMSLLEYCNQNHPLLRQLIKKAPGTFQHSIMVANLAEEAVYRIEGNTLLTRTGAMYHDVGKIYDPILFIENQAGGISPHIHIPYDESARKIIAHVEKGVELANAYHLPEVIVNFIRTHHGRSKVKYFYNSFKNKFPDKEIDEKDFTYPGPDPVTKECAVVMMADAVEAASRTLEIKTEENIKKLVSDIIDMQLKDGRFANADISFKDISIIKNIFTEQLSNIYHSRITYPRLEKKSEEEKEDIDI